MTKVLRQFRGAGETIVGVARDATADVFAQQRIRDLPLPSMRQRPLQIADHHLIQQHAQRVNIALNRERLPGKNFRRRVHPRAGARGIIRPAQSFGETRERDVARFQLPAIREDADAEIRQARPGSARLAVDENVGRFDVLVQDADRMRRGDRFRGPRDNIQARAERHLVDASLRGGPIGEIARLGEIALEIVRRLVELDFVQLCDVGPIAQRIAEQAEQCEFTFERSQTIRIEAELVDALGPGLAMLGEPNFAEAAFAKSPFEKPLLAAGDRQARRGPPAEHFLFAGRDGTAALLSVGRRVQRGHAGRADLEDVHRFLGAGEKIRAMRHPAKFRDFRRCPGFRSFRNFRGREFGRSGARFAVE